MVFQPVALVDSIVGLVGRVTDVEVTEEATILHTRRMQGDGVFEVDVHKRPLRGVGIVDVLRNKEKLVAAPNEGGAELSNRGMLGVAAV